MSTKTIRIKIASGNSKQQIDSLDKSMKGLGKEADNTSNSFSRLKGAVIAVAAALQARQIIAYADAFTASQNAIKQTTKTTEQLTTRTQQLFDISQRARTGIQETADLYSQMSLATEELGFSTEKTLGITETISKAFSINSKNSAGTAGAIRQLNQAFSAGALRGDEYNSIAEQAPEIMRALKRETGLTSGELRKFAAEGGITAELLIKSIGNSADIINLKFRNAGKTFAQFTQEAENNAIKFVGSSELLSSSVTGAGKAIVALSNNLDLIAGGVLIAATIGMTTLTATLINNTLETIRNNTEKLKSVAADASQIKSTADKEKAIASAFVTEQRIRLVQAKASRDAAIQALKEAKDAAAAEILKEKSIASAALTEQRIRVVSAASKKAAAVDAVKLARAEMVAANEVVTSTKAAAVAQTATAADVAKAKKASETAAKVLSKAEIEVSAASKLLAKESTSTAAAMTALTAAKERDIALSNGVVVADSNIAAASALVAKEKLAASAASANLTKAKAVSVAASGAVVKANASMALSSRIAAASMGALRGAMAFLGGPLGVVLLAASAIAIYASRADEASDPTKTLKGDVDKLTESFSKFNRAQTVVEIDKTNQRLFAARKEMIALTSEVDRLEKKFNSATELGERGGFSKRQLENKEEQLKKVKKEVRRLEAAVKALFDAGFDRDFEGASDHADDKPSNVGAARKDPFINSEKFRTAALRAELNERLSIQRAFNETALQDDAAQFQVMAANARFDQLAALAALERKQADAEIDFQFSKEKLRERSFEFESDRQAIDEELNTQRLIQAEIFESEKLKIQEEYSERSIGVSKLEAQTKQEIVASAINAAVFAMSAGGKKTNKAQRITAKIGASISGYHAAVEAWKSGMSTGGPYAPLVAAAYTAASLTKTAGLISQINSTQGGNAASASAPVSVATPQRQEPISSNTLVIENRGLAEILLELQKRDPNESVPLEYALRIAQAQADVKRLGGRNE